MIIFHEYNKKSAFIEALVDYTNKALNSALAAAPVSEKAPASQRSVVTWAVSGGSTPLPFFTAMNQQALDWARVTIALVDERWVDLKHSRSNEAFIRQHLGCGKSASATIVGMKTKAETPFQGADDVEARYQALPALGPVLLGMGSDGHVASLFPVAEGLKDAMVPHGPRLTVPIRAAKSDIVGEELYRMSLSLWAIASAPSPYLMMTGRIKREIFDAALEGGDLPIARLVRARAQLSRKPLDVFWMP